MEDKVVKLTYKGDVDANVGGKSIHNMPDVLLIGTGSSGLHEARTIFMDDKKDAADYIVAYDPVKEGGFSMGICGTGRKFDMVVPSSNYQHMSVMGEWGIVMKPPSCFRKIEGPGTVLWKKRVKAKRRY